MRSCRFNSQSVMPMLGARSKTNNNINTHKNKKIKSIHNHIYSDKILVYGFSYSKCYGIVPQSACDACVTVQTLCISLGNVE